MEFPTVLWRKIGGSLVKFYREINGGGFVTLFSDGEHNKEKYAVTMVRLFFTCFTSL